MGIAALSQGYGRIISGIYSPKPYHARVRAFLREYTPKKSKRLRFHGRYLSLHYGYAWAFPRSLFLLGIKDRARFHYWKLLFWSLFRRPMLFPMAVTFAIYGFHFRKGLSK